MNFAMRLSVCRKVDFGSAEYGGGLVEFPVAPEENRSLPTCRAIGFDPVACGCESGKENFSPVRLFAPKNDIPNPAKPCFRRFQPIGKRVKAKQTLFVLLYFRYLANKFCSLRSGMPARHASPCGAAFRGSNPRLRNYSPAIRLTAPHFFPAARE